MQPSMRATYVTEVQRDPWNAKHVHLENFTTRLLVMKFVSHVVAAHILPATEVQHVLHVLLDQKYMMRPRQKYLLANVAPNAR
jgi:hypothetical protein